MGNEIPPSVPTGESWTVSYGDEICFDACKLDGTWYFRKTPGDSFQEFPVQANVTPICTNPTKSKARVA
jgi:hypothetical protein